MADDSMALLETLRKAGTDGDVDFLRQGLEVLAGALMEAEVTGVTGEPGGGPGTPSTGSPSATGTGSGAGTAGGHDRPRGAPGSGTAATSLAARTPTAGDRSRLTQLAPVSTALGEEGGQG
jgi:hypothetical protein